MEDRVRICHSNDPKKMVAEIFHTFSSNEGFFDLKYWSYPALLELYLGVYELVKDYFTDPIVRENLKTKGQKAMVKRWITVRDKTFLHIPKSREGMFKRIFEDIFKGFGCGTLHGYGFSNRFGDQLTGNPERSSYVRR